MKALNGARYLIEFREALRSPDIVALDHGPLCYVSGRPGKDDYTYVDYYASRFELRAKSLDDFHFQFEGPGSNEFYTQIMPAFEALNEKPPLDCTQDLRTHKLQQHEQLKLDSGLSDEQREQLRVETESQRTTEGLYPRGSNPKDETEALEDQLWLTATNDRDSIENDLYWGVCEHCGRNDGYMNLGTEHWFVCHEHEVRWNRGENLFSSWKSETKEDWDQNWQEISAYKIVDPLYQNNITVEEVAELRNHHISSRQGM